MNTNTKFNQVPRFLGLLLLATVAAQARDLPPTDSKPLSAIILSVEAQNLGVITEVEFDDGLWEVTVRKGRVSLQLYLDPRSGTERRRRTDASDGPLPPRNAKPLSEIVRSLETQNLGVITDIEFDDGYWEVEFRKEGQKVKMDFHPRTGKPRR
jgi:hypothetical protein